MAPAWRRGPETEKSGLCSGLICSTWNSTVELVGKHLIGESTVESACRVLDTRVWPSPVAPPRTADGPAIWRSNGSGGRLTAASHIVDDPSAVLLLIRVSRGTVIHTPDNIQPPRPLEQSKACEADICPTPPERFDRAAPLRISPGRPMTGTPGPPKAPYPLQGIARASQRRLESCGCELELTAHCRRLAGPSSAPPCRTNQRQITNRQATSASRS